MTAQQLIDEVLKYPELYREPDIAPKLARMLTMAMRFMDQMSLHDPESFIGLKVRVIKAELDRIASGGTE